MNPFRSVGSLLAAALALVVAIALGVAWIVIVPTLERNLTRAKLDQQASRAAAAVKRFPVFSFEHPEAGPNEIQNWAAENAALVNTRIVVYSIQSGADSPLGRVRADSEELSIDVADDPLAMRAARFGRTTEGVVAREGVRYAQVAVPIRRTKAVVLFASPLEDTVASVRQVKRRLLVAGGLALGIAVLLGFGAASLFARRIRRLERAADRIAGGRLDEPVVDRGRDEIGQLADAFERMRRQLVRLDHARREFIANASHELRTPIFSLGGFLELIAGEDIDEETRREFIGTMQEQLGRLQRLATDLLDLSRLDAGQLSLELERVDVARVAEELAEEFAAVALSSDHPIELAPAGGVEALADETWTLRIGRALLDNAIRHTPGGTPIRLSAGRANGRAVLSVEDAGPGIPPDQAVQIFERFHRADGGHASGSGLGLAIARELADAMGGRVALESGPGRTVFSLELPVAAGPFPRENGGTRLPS
ncbi:MAG TPA: HAMP domain-containing sensor histidine kinase [Gaiellaceae bacterium]|nr:HAMP domain-containing sensor histidine kinase [Gaiellaceae bacterium]